MANVTTTAHSGASHWQNYPTNTQLINDYYSSLDSVLFQNCRDCGSRVACDYESAFYDSPIIYWTVKCFATTGPIIPGADENNWQTVPQKQYAVQVASYTHA